MQKTPSFRQAIDNPGATANCIECHQGRDRTLSVESNRRLLKTRSTRSKFYQCPLLVMLHQYGSDVAINIQAKPTMVSFPMLKAINSVPVPDPHSTSLPPIMPLHCCHRLSTLRHQSGRSPAMVTPPKASITKYNPAQSAYSPFK